MTYNDFGRFDNTKRVEERATQLSKAAARDLCRPDPIIAIAEYRNGVTADTCNPVRLTQIMISAKIGPAHCVKIVQAAVDIQSISFQRCIGIPVDGKAAGPERSDGAYAGI